MRSLVDELAAKPPEAFAGWTYGTLGLILPQEPCEDLSGSQALAHDEGSVRAPTVSRCRYTSAM
jgi:hypothetical protein